jgi:hypothetical protein
VEDAPDRLVLWVLFPPCPSRPLLFDASMTAPHLRYNDIKEKPMGSCVEREHKPAATSCHSSKFNSLIPFNRRKKSSYGARTSTPVPVCPARAVRPRRWISVQTPSVRSHRFKMNRKIRTLLNATGYPYLNDVGDPWYVYAPCGHIACE